MSIKILPPQLANQIAAGEVVERPASVVKELVENSLDAGANQIQIDIEQGGANLIRVRDNGVGIAKEELALALTRHATSKISSLADLEAILSLGFRGEALASISSVSRLTLTSRPREQQEAWQVYAQGRDMEIQIQPAAHPVGCSVEVANLFFNTPARRKFLRTEKTEFQHIDEVIRRIALVKNHISFTLTHNGKIIRQYKAAADSRQQLKRVAAICGEDFVRQALHLDWKHQDLHLSGWIALPPFSRPHNDLAYSYVNGRMVKDKVITHAIRQAYHEWLQQDHYPAFVLFLDINPNDVDVNVHPTKHEVRFQQSRLVHDFIYQGVSNALNSHMRPSLTDYEHKQTRQETPNQANQIREPAPTWQVSAEPNRASAGQNMFSATQGQFGETRRPASAHSQPPRSYQATSQVSQRQQALYQQLLTPQRSSAEQEASVSPDAEDRLANLPEPYEASSINKTSINVNPSNATTATVGETAPHSPHIGSSQHLHALALVANKALLLQQQEQFYLLPLAQLAYLHFSLKLQHQPISQALLIPLALRLDPAQLQAWQQQKAYFRQIGLAYHENLAQQRITIQQVPHYLRQQNWQKCLMALLSQPIEKFSQFLTALYAQLTLEPIQTLAEAINQLNEVEQLLHTHNLTPQPLHDLFIRLDLAQYLV